MTSGLLKSTTAMMLVISMSVTPAIGYAQQDNGENAELTDEELLRLKLEEEAEKAAEEGQGLVNQAQDALRGNAEQPEAEAGSEVAEETPAEDAPAAEPEVAEEAPAENAPAAEPEVAEDAPAANEPAAEPDVAEDAPAAEPEVAEEAPAAEAPQAEPEVAEEAPAGNAPAAEAEMADDAPAAEPDVAQDADPQGTTDETVVERGSNALRGSAEEPAAETAAADEPAPETAATEDAEPMDSAAQAEAQAEADAAATGSLAASGEGEVEEAEVVEETVTEETARSSAEEFDTDLRGEARARNTDDDDDDDGLSNFEKAALLGLGAVTIGSLLRNNETVAANTGDRVVVERDGQYRIIKNDDALLRQPGSDVKTYRYSDGSTRTVVTRTDGIEVETVRAADGRVLRRTRTLEDGSTVVLFDDTQASQDVVVNDLPQTTDRRTVQFADVDPDDLAATLASAQAANVDRTFSLSQIRNIDAVRQLVPEINVDTINFETNSAVIRPEEAEELAALGNAMRAMIADNPSEVFLVEGHTDAVGAGSYNLALSDRRAESVALALTEYFDVPPENLVVQGYGESDLLIRTPEAERANRRAAVRRITPLLDGAT
ncbi:OmpA family protein [Thalassococcus sp. BH17M4-6]|uniref:OmpA family protein n=1 Tax=Thalassococcus sp. BH17M4-6 TaxID=3413148 RepID=UPI003BBC722A